MGFISTYGLKILAVITAILLIVCIVLSFVIYGLNKTVDMHKEKVESCKQSKLVLAAECERDKLIQISKIKQLEIDFAAAQQKAVAENISNNTKVKETTKVDKEKVSEVIKQAEANEDFSSIWTSIELIVNKL
jgi:preprotein translocase subunit SecF